MCALKCRKEKELLKLSRFFKFEKIEWKLNKGSYHVFPFPQLNIKMIFTP